MSSFTYNCNAGFSVRCLRDPLTVVTTAVSSITASSATCGGNVLADGGPEVTARGVCWSTSQNPTIADSHTTDGSGTGSFNSNITGLSGNTTYYVRAYATNGEGTAYGSQVTFKTDLPFTCGTSKVKDIDNNEYNTVQIGSQCWMKENMKTTKYADGTSIFSDMMFNPDNSENHVATYGKLYMWFAATRDSSTTYPAAGQVKVQGICPTGWHVPSDTEWTQLTDYVNSQSGYKCGGTDKNIAKALASATGWDSETTTCAVGKDQLENNATGFSAVPAGLCIDGSYYNFFGKRAYFWSATQIDNKDAWSRNLYGNISYVNRYDESKGNGFPVRCLKD